MTRWSGECGSPTIGGPTSDWTWAVIPQGPPLVLRGLQSRSTCHRGLPLRIERARAEHSGVSSGRDGQPLLGQTHVERRGRHDARRDRLCRSHDELRSRSLRPPADPAAIRLIVNPDPGTWESDRTIGGTDYGLRLNQLLRLSRTPDGPGLAPPGQLRVDGGRRFGGSGQRSTCNGGTPDDPCRRPLFPNSGTGGLGFIYGPLNRSSSHRDQFDADVSVYAGNHELKFGGDYEDAATDASTYFTGGQIVQRRNEWGAELLPSRLLRPQPDRFDASGYVQPGGTFAIRQSTFRTHGRPCRA